MKTSKPVNTAAHIAQLILAVMFVFVLVKTLSAVSVAYAAGTRDPAVSGVTDPVAQAAPLLTATSIPARPAATPTFVPTVPATPPSGLLGNISTRGRVGTGDDVLIGGFIIASAPVKVVVRAIGPSMANATPPVAGTLQDPVLQLFSGQTMIAQNDNWQAGNCPTEAPNRNPSDIREACLAITLDPGPYTAIVRGASGATGVGLVEVFYASGAGFLSNISTRGRVGTDADVLIGGFIVAGTPAQVVVRAIGPSMANVTPPVAGTLPDPMLQLFSGQTVIAQNDNWQVGNCPTQAPDRNPQDIHESCLTINVAAGNYTAIVSGAGGATGVGLVEIFLSK